MITPIPATAIVLIFIIIFGVILPILDKTEMFGKFISLRWCIVVTFVAMFVGCILDFEQLNDSVRLAVVLGALIVGGIFILIRTWEKAAVNGWSIGIKNVEVSKGDAKVTVHVDDDNK